MEPWERPREEFKLHKKLGEGHFGEVWEAQWTTENKKVAIKMLKQGTCAPPVPGPPSSCVRSHSHQASEKVSSSRRCSSPPSHTSQCLTSSSPSRCVEPTNHRGRTLVEKVDSVDCVRSGAEHNLHVWFLSRMHCGYSHGPKHNNGANKRHSPRVPERLEPNICAPTCFLFTGAEVRFPQGFT